MAEKIPYKEIEIDIWAFESDSVTQFVRDFERLNHGNVKYIGYEVLKKTEVDKRVSLFFVKFWNEEIEYPEQDYYQLNNAFL